MVIVTVKVKAKVKVMVKVKVIVMLYVTLKVMLASFAYCWLVMCQFQIPNYSLVQIVPNFSCLLCWFQILICLSVQIVLYSPLFFVLMALSILSLNCNTIRDQSVKLCR